MKLIKIYLKLVIFTLVNNKLEIFLIKNRLPFEKLNSCVDLDQKVKEIFEKNTSSQLTDCYFEQLYTTSTDKSINIIYYILIPEERIIKNKSLWHENNDQLKTSEDYSIIAYALQRLQWKIEYTNVVYGLLPDEFSLSTLQKTYEAIFGRRLDKRNFRKKILSLKFLIPTIKKIDGNTRPAQLYKFDVKKPIIVNIF